MAIDYSEQRDFIRMETDCTVNYSITGSGETKQGVCRNLSATGILFYSKEPIAENTKLDIHIEAGSSMIPPLKAVIQVVRIKPNGNNDFEVAGFITEML